MKVNIEFDTSTATSEDHQLLSRVVEAINGMPATPAKVGKATVTVKAPEPVDGSDIDPDDPTENGDEEVVEAEVVEDSEDSDEALMEQAVQKATKLVSDGKASEVKAALEKAGARRVSELKDRGGILKFLEALG